MKKNHHKEGVTMKIIKMEKKSNGKYRIKLSNGETLTTYDDVILKYQLLYEKEITSELFNELYQETKYYDIYNKVIQYIKTRMRCTHEIKQYLKKYQVLPKEEEKILQELQQKGFLDDLRFAKAYVSDKFYLGHDGLHKIKSNLEKLYIPNEYIQTALDQIGEEEVFNQLRHMIEKKKKSNHKYSLYQFKEKMMLEFLQKGYTREMIQNCLEQINQDDSSILQKEYEKQKKRLSKKYSGSELYYHIKGKLYQKGYQTEDINKVIEE